MAETRRTRRAVALAGNAVALVLIGLLLLAGPRLFGVPNPPSPDEGGSVSPGAAPVLVVVIDALRDDTARDATLMPNLAALADAGARATWRVDLLVPSTVGALESVVEGRAPPPVAALRDFGASAATHGGWLQLAAEGGGGVSVAGPDLWTERYGAWIDEAHDEPGMPSAASDVRVAGAARRALAGEAPRVVVAHLAELDATAHRHGAGGAEWRAAARRIDARLGEVLDAAGDGRAVVVLADHGTTRRGGHAGSEAVVRRAPLVVAPAAPVSLPAPGLASMPESGATRASVSLPEGEVLDPHRLLLALVSGKSTVDAVADSRAGASAADAGASGTATTEGPGRTRAAAAVSLVAGGLVATGAARALAAGPVPGFALSAALWLAIALAVSGRVAAGAALVVAAVLVAASLALRRRLATARSSARPPARPPDRPSARPLAGDLVRSLRGPGIAFLCGAALACASVAIAARTADAPAAFGDATLVALAVLVGLAAGALSGGLRSALAGGIALAAGIALAVHAGGETLSLSSVDVRLAHRAAGLVPGPDGIVLAAPVALARLALPIVAVLVGHAMADARRSRIAPDPDPHRRAVAVASAFAACQLGAAAVHALCLARPPDPALASGLPLAATGLGGLLRECVTAVLVFGTLVARGAPRASDEPEPAAG